MNKFSDELADVVEKKDQEAYDHMAKAGEALINFINGGEPKNINPLTDIPEPQMTLYGYESWLIGVYFDTEEELIEHLKSSEASMPIGVYVYEFMGNMAGRKSVIRKTNKDGAQKYVVASSPDYVAVYNDRRSRHQGRFVWEGGPSCLRGLYNAFEERGIVIENDVYARDDVIRSVIRRALKAEAENKAN